jgi:nodulation protein E
VKDSGIEVTDALSPRFAAIIGTGIGGAGSQDDAYLAMLRAKRRPHPLTILRVIPNAAASHLSIRHGLRGPAFAISSACASGAHAIGLCAELIRSGAADAGLAGASEALLTYGPLEAWRAMHILSDEFCRPFSKNRKGLVIGEGSGVLVLEEFERARARGATIRAEIVGFGMNADGKDMINPAVEGATAAMRAALKDLGAVDPGAVYVNAHGTGTLMNDPTETKAIRETFGADADRLIVSSTKSMHGHLLGAAGGVEAVASILALERGVIPPTINYDEPDPACDLNYCPNEAQARRVDLAVSNSFAFGGLNAVLAFARV